MKTYFFPTLVSIVFASFSTHGLAQTAKISDGVAAPVKIASAAQTPLTEGVVKKVDQPGARVTLAHGPLPGGMPAMTMTYRVKDASWLAGVAPGQKIRFAVDPVDGMTVVRFEAIK